MDKNKRVTIWAGVAVSMVIVMLVVWPHKRQGNNRPDNLKASTAQASAKASEPVAASATPLSLDISVSTSTPSAASSTVASSPTTIYKYRPKKSIPNPTIPSYGEVVNSYQDHRIQFDQSCRAIPSQEVMANNTTVMLDNRSDIAQKIIIGGQTYTVAAYNYVLATLNQEILPAHLLVTCNTQVNTAEIILE